MAAGRSKCDFILAVYDVRWAGIRCKRFPLNYNYDISEAAAATVEWIALGFELPSHYSLPVALTVAVPLKFPLVTMGNPERVRVKRGVKIDLL